MRFWKFIINSKNSSNNEQQQNNDLSLNDERVNSSYESPKSINDTYSSDNSLNTLESTFENKNERDLKDTQSKEQENYNENSSNNTITTINSSSVNLNNKTQTTGNVQSSEEQKMSNKDKPDINQEGMSYKKTKNEEAQNRENREQKTLNLSNTNSSRNVDDENSKELPLDTSQKEVKSDNVSAEQQSNPSSEDLKDEKNNKRQELLNTLKKRLERLTNEKGTQMKKNENTSNEPEINQNTELLKELERLPSFEERQKNDGYSIDTNTLVDVNDIIIRNLIKKFLNQRFTKNDTDLNQRSTSLEKRDGFYKWDVKDIITHLKTKQLTKVLRDKYGYQYAQGKFETVPLSFYFDLSGSMDKYTSMLATIAIELLKKDVKVLVGFNECVKVQIDKIKDNISINELAVVLKKKSFYYSQPQNFEYNNRIDYKMINQDLNEYLFSKKCEKCAVFADFDPINDIIGLSDHAQVYWFCFEEENDITEEKVKNFNGFIYGVQSLEDIKEGLKRVNEKRFEMLVHFNKQLINKKRGK